MWHENIFLFSPLKKYFWLKYFEGGSSEKKKIHCLIKSSFHKEKKKKFRRQESKGNDLNVNTQIISRIPHAFANIFSCTENMDGKVRRNERSIQIFEVPIMLWNINIYVLNIKHFSSRSIFFLPFPLKCWEVSKRVVKFQRKYFRLQEFQSSSNKCWGKMLCKNLKNLMKNLDFLYCLTEGLKTKLKRLKKKRKKNSVSMSFTKSIYRRGVFKCRKQVPVSSVIGRKVGHQT